MFLTDVILLAVGFAAVALSVLCLAGACLAAADAARIIRNSRLSADARTIGA